MSAALLYLSEAWNFFRKQPVLNDVLLWLIFLPSLLGTFSRFAIQNINGTWGLRPAPVEMLLDGFVQLAALLWVCWGIAAVLLVAKRIVKSPAGRSRTSFATVRSQAGRLLIPLVLTSLLRECVALFYSLPYIVAFFAVAFALRLEEEHHILLAALALTPLLFFAIVYRLKTSLANVVLVCEKKEYRAALRRSAEIARGKLWRLFGAQLGVGLFLMLAIITVIVGVEVIATSLDSRLSVLTDIVSAVGSAFCTLLFTLALTLIYKSFLSRSAHGTA